MTGFGHTLDTDMDSVHWMCVCVCVRWLNALHNITHHHHHHRQQHQQTVTLKRVGIGKKHETYGYTTAAAAAAVAKKSITNLSWVLGLRCDIAIVRQLHCRLIAVVVYNRIRMRAAKTAHIVCVTTRESIIAFVPPLCAHDDGDGDFVLSNTAAPSERERARDAFTDAYARAICVPCVAWIDDCDTDYDVAHTEAINTPLTHTICNWNGRGWIATIGRAMKIRWVATALH